MKKKLTIIVAVAFIVRVIFYLVGARIYYGNENFTTNGDTIGWIDSILNLIHHGIYTSDMEVFNGRFYRPPGYAFFIGIFYGLTGSIESALKIIPWVQIVCDTIAVLLFGKIAKLIFKSDGIQLLATLLYALYPFVIVWTPIVVAESISISLFIAALYFYFTKKPKLVLLSGILLGVSVLSRLQIIFIFPFLVLGLFFSEEKIIRLRQTILFVIGFSVSYGLWPVRNYVNHNRIMFAQTLEVGRNWSPDYLAFMDYIFGIQTDHKPQYDQIVGFQTVEWPEASYISEGDSALLARTIDSCRVCGTGFSYFMRTIGARKDVVPKELNCDEYIAANFKKLTLEQKEHNKLNYYVKVPLSNLYKSFFKISLYGDKSFVVKMAGSVLFLYRTLMILIGIAGLILLYRNKFNSHSIVFIISGFVTTWYLYLSFIYRNIEIRYLLPPDLLLLFPACYLIHYYFTKKKLRNLS